MYWLLIALLTSTPLMILFFFVWFYLWAKKKHTYWLQRGIYSPPTHWLYGHVFNYETGTFSIAQHLADICRSPLHQHIPAIGIYIFHKPCLLLRDPTLIRKLLLNDFQFFANRRLCMQSQNDVIDNANLYNLKSSRWSYLRVLLEMSFSRDRLQAMFPLMFESAEHLRRYLDRQVPSSGRVEIPVHEVSRRFVTDIMISIIFGVSTNSFEEPDTEIYKHACGLYKKSQSSLLLVFIRIMFPRLRSPFGTSTTHTDFFRDLFWKSMNERKNTLGPRGDLVDMLLELYSVPDRHFKFEGHELFAQAMLLVIAGLESSAMAMTLSLFEMIRNANIQKRLRRKIREKIGSSPITFELICKINYLEYIVSETLRVYPPTPFLNRVAQQNYQVPNSNIVIERGTVIYVSLRGLHLNPLSFPNPMIYDPDRFNKHNSWRIEKGTYLPFGDGPRKCLGSRITLLQIMLGLVVVMRDYKISINENMRDKAETTSAILNKDFLITLEKSPVIND